MKVFIVIDESRDTSFVHVSNFGYNQWLSARDG